VYDLILESVGGSSLTHAIRLVAEHGTIGSFGASANEPTTLPVEDFYFRRARQVGFVLPAADAPPFARDLHHLASLVSNGALPAPVSVEASWRQAGRVLRDLVDRRIDGKAVLLIG
jgi:NADPH:quinone reductase